jgi:hypothetical protein
MINIDLDTCQKSLFYLMDSLELLIGANGTKAVLRSAGQKAAANLIEMLPLTLPEDEAARRIGSMLVELGFITEMNETSPGKYQVIGNHVLEEMTALGLHCMQSGTYYVIGIFEGFFKTLSGSKRKVVSVQPGENCEYWILG